MTSRPDQDDWLVHNRNEPQDPIMDNGARGNMWEGLWTFLPSSGDRQQNVSSFEGTTV